MSENDTIPAVLRIDHHAELRRLADLLEKEHGPDDEYTGYCADHIRDHADALANALAEERRVNASSRDWLLRERNECRDRRDRQRAIYEARLAEAEARAERLQEALVDEHLKWEAWVAEITNQQGKIDTSRAGAIALIRASQPTLKDGDLPDPDGGDAS